MKPTTLPTAGACSIREAGLIAGGISEATVRRLLKAGDFPEPFEVTQGRRAFLRQEVIAWAEARAARFRAKVAPRRHRREVEATEPRG